MGTYSVTVVTNATQSIRIKLYFDWYQCIWLGTRATQDRYVNIAEKYIQKLTIHDNSYQMSLVLILQGAERVFRLKDSATLSVLYIIGIKGFSPSKQTGDKT